MNVGEPESVIKECKHQIIAGAIENLDRAIQMLERLELRIVDGDAPDSSKVPGAPRPTQPLTNFLSTSAGLIDELASRIDVSTRNINSGLFYGKDWRDEYEG